MFVHRTTNGKRGLKAAAKRGRPVTTLVLYSRPGCCLCDTAKAALVGVQERYGFRLEEVDISGDEELSRRFGHEIPVGVIDGRVVFRYRVSRAVLDRLFGRPPADKNA